MAFSCILRLDILNIFYLDGLEKNNIIMNGMKYQHFAHVPTHENTTGKDISGSTAL